MDIYLPIAGLSVNALLIVALGGLVGVLSGMFGVGGGFLTTPLLIFYGIPPTVAVASATTQITGSSVSGVFAHLRRGGRGFLSRRGYRLPCRFSRGGHGLDGCGHGLGRPFQRRRHLFNG